MRVFVSSSLRRPLVLAALVAAGPALAQAPAAVPDTPKVGRTISSTGRTMPPPRNAPAQAKPATEGEMIKAQKASEARAKAWDAKMHRTMTSICHGC